MLLLFILDKKKEGKRKRIPEEDQIVNRDILSTEDKKRSMCVFCRERKTYVIATKLGLNRGNAQCHKGSDKDR